MKRDMTAMIEKFVITAMVSNPSFHFFYDNSGLEPQFCVEAKRGNHLTFILPDGAYHRSGDGIYYKDNNGNVHTLLSFRYT